MKTTFMPSPRSKSVFHFTKSLDAIKSILSDEGFRINYSIEHFNWIHPRFEALIPMVCFCDIPLGRCSRHTDKYGTYGIGLTKKWLLSNAANQVTYVSKNSYMSQAIRKMHVEMATHIHIIEDQAYQEFLRSLFYPMLYFKPYEHENQQYHEECEWRIVPPNLNHLIFHAEGSALAYRTLMEGQLIKYDNIRFNPFDVEHILAKNADDKDIIINHINSMTLADSERKKLISSVSTFDAIDENHHDY